MKRWLAAGFLIAFGLWPAVQHGLSLRYGVDPWKLAGWAMYSVPAPRVTVRIAGVRPDGSRRLLDYRRYRADEQLVVDRFRNRRQSLGRLEPAGRLARDFLALHPEWSEIEVRVIELRLEPASASLRAWVDAYHLEREPAPPPPG